MSEEVSTHQDVISCCDDSITVIGDNTIIQNITQYNFKAPRPTEGRSFNSSSDESQYVELIIRQPEIKLTLFPKPPVYSCTNTSLAFPDRKLDHRFELSLFKNSRDVLDCDFTDPHDLNIWGIDVSVKRVDQDGNDFSGSSLGCLFTSYKKRDLRKIGKGKYGFWFRFQRKNAKYRITFTLKYYTREKTRGGNEKTSEEIIHSFEAIVFTDLKRDVNKAISFNPNSTQVARIKVGGVGNDHDHIITSLCRLRDQGKWEKFDKKASNFLAENFDDIETKAVILLEMSMGACYNNKLDVARKLIEETLRLTELSEAQSVFIARAHYYLAGIHRREKNFGEAEKCIQIAEQNLDHVESDLDRAMLLYEKGGSLMDFIGVGARKPSESLVHMTKKNLEQCIEIFESLEDRIYTKKHHFALLRIAMLMLDCRTKAGRARAVKPEDIKSAEQCLNALKGHFKRGAPRGLRVQYMMARSDEFYRNGEFTDAVENAKESLALAKQWGFNTEISTLEDRVNFYQSYAVKQHEELGLLSEEEYPSCDDVSTPGHGGDVSSSS